MIIMKDTNERITGAYYYCLSTEKENGSPLNKPCSYTCCLRTADRKSTSRKISKSAGPVPLYLIPQARSKEIRELKDAIVDPGGDVTPDSSDVCTCALGVHCMCTFEVHTKKSENSGFFSDSDKMNRNYLSNDLNVHRNVRAQEGSVSSALSHRLCSFEKSAHIDPKACKLIQIKFTGRRVAC